MWKDIEGFDNYEVSTEGEVRNKKYNRLLTPSPGAGGYLRVNLRRDKKSYPYYIHRLVALAFLEGEGEVNHIDGNRTNNKVENLEWTTHQQNVQHAFTVLHRTPGRKEKGVRVVYTDGTEKIFSSTKECALYYNIDRGTIRDYVKYKLTQHRQI